MNDQLRERFHQFLHTASFQKELPLVIAHHDQELREFTGLLQEFQFVPVSNVPEIMRALATGGNYFFHIKTENEKYAYDLAVQYATGQVGLFDDKRAENVAATPRYEKLCFVLLTTKPCLFDLQENGMDLLKKTGMTFQS